MLVGPFTEMWEIQGLHAGLSEKQDLAKFVFCLIVFASLWVTFSIISSETASIFFKLMNYIKEDP